MPSLTKQLTLPVLLTLSLAASANAQESGNNPLASLPWQAGPATGQLGDVASIVVPEGYRFVDRAGASKFLELTQNPSHGNELGVLLSDDGSWFVIFRFSDDGYVKDDDRKLDADAILSSIRSGTEESNKIRQQRGWATIEVVGWQQKPFYDSATNNLTWSIRGKSGDEASINHSTRLLGRRGVMDDGRLRQPLCRAPHLFEWGDRRAVRTGPRRAERSADGLSALVEGALTVTGIS